MIDVCLVTTWGKACGIAEHSAMLIDALAVEDDIEVHPSEAELDPDYFFREANAAGDTVRPSVLHLNYHAALHSRWEPEHVAQARALGYPVVITYHDTMRGDAEQPNSDKAKRLAAAANLFVVHEPVRDIPEALYLRQGVPGPEDPWRWNTMGRPIVGTCGFDFPWKNYDLLASASYAAGWAVAFCGGTLSEARQNALLDANPYAHFLEGFPSRRQIVSGLAGCDATAFLYLNANTGTSAAIRLGIAARQPLLATHSMACRQFGDLANEKAITWLPDLSPAAVAQKLSEVRPHYKLHALAEQDSWQHMGEHYATLYRSLAG